MPQTLIPGLRGRVDSKESPSPPWSQVLPRFQRPRLELYDDFIKWDNSDPTNNPCPKSGLKAAFPDHTEITCMLNIHVNSVMGHCLLLMKNRMRILN